MKVREAAQTAELEAAALEASEHLIAVKMSRT